MPLYEYECTKCGHRFEVIQKFSDPPRKSCPRCRAGVRKLLSAPAIQFKGSGWYVTDYGGKGKESGGDSSKGKDASGGSGEASKSAAAEKPAPGKKDAAPGDKKKGSK